MSELSVKDTIKKYYLDLKHRAETEGMRLTETPPPVMLSNGKTDQEMLAEALKGEAGKAFLAWFLNDE